jgi:hypothetical protein
VRAFELPDEAKATLRELQDLSKEAEAGNKEARKELRKVLRASAPEIVARCSDIARSGQLILAETMAAGDPLIEEAIPTRLDLMRAEVAGENPTPLEVLLTERIVSAWLVVEAQEALLNAQLKRGSEVKRCPLSYLKFMIGWLDSAHRRYLAAIKSLAQVRRLQSNTPAVQVNTQINVSPESALHQKSVLTQNSKR